MCRNDELSWLFTKRFRVRYGYPLSTLFAKNSQNLLRIAVITILLTFIYLIYLVAQNLLVNNQLNSSFNATYLCGT